MSDAAPATKALETGGDDLDKRQQQVFWQRYFQVYDTLRESIPYCRMIARQVDWLEPLNGRRVLDAGTGTGNVALELIDRGADVVGVDFCEEALVICRQKMDRGDFRFADLTGRLEFSDASFARVACGNVIYTLAPEDQETACRELFRVLEPGGTACITVFGHGFKALRVYFVTLREYARIHGLVATVAFGARYSINTLRILYYVGRIKRRQRGGAYTFYTREQFRGLLERAGFVVERLEPVFAGQNWIALARRPMEDE